MDGDEPRQARGEWTHPAAGLHTYPPRKQRWPGPRQRCPRCDAVVEGQWERCPVCETRFPARTAIGRFAERVLRRG